jgi:hypothetical protein
MLKDVVDGLEVEAVLLTALPNARPDQIFCHVLSIPKACPACGDLWALLLNKPLTLEVELGEVGTQHLALLEKAMVEECACEKSATHLRTDGKTVWLPQ